MRSLPPILTLLLPLLLAMAAARHGPSHWPSDERWLNDIGGMACSTSGSGGGPQPDPHVVFSWHDNGVIHLNATGFNANLPTCTFRVFMYDFIIHDANGKQPAGLSSLSDTPCVATATAKQCNATLEVGWWVYFWDDLHTFECTTDQTVTFWGTNAIGPYLEIQYGFDVNGLMVGTPQSIYVFWSCLDPYPGTIPSTPCEKVGDAWACPSA